MNELALTREVDAPADTLWQVLTDLDGCPGFISGITGIERLAGDPGFAVGTRWRETRVLFGREASEEMAVTAVEPGHSYTVEADGQGARYRSTFVVDALPSERSRLSMTFGSEPTGLISSVMAKTVGKLFEGATRKAMEQDLDDIAAEAERRSRS